MTNVFHVGEKNKDCAACRKPFDNTCKDAGCVQIAFLKAPVDIRFSYSICADCMAACQRGGAERNGVLTAVDAYHEGEEASQ